MVVDAFDTDEVIAATDIEAAAEDVTTPTVTVAGASSPSTPSSNTNTTSSPSITNSPESYEGPVRFRSIADIYANTEEVVGIDEEEGEVMIVISEDPHVIKKLQPRLVGIEVEQQKSRILLRQSAYAKKILSQFKMTDCNSTKHSMEPKTQLHKDLEGTQVNATEYRRIIGCLRYLLHTRANLSYYVGMASRYMERPIIMHHKKQKTVALSSCEAEFMAATTAAYHALWLRSLASELIGVEPKSEEITKEFEERKIELEAKALEIYQASDADIKIERYLIVTEDSMHALSMANHNLQLGNNTATYTTNNQEILNYDQLAEVFSYLPAKNLFRLQLVSKSLKNMITSDRLFHLMQSYHNTDAAAAILVDNNYSRPQLFILDPDAGIPRAALDILPAYGYSEILCSAGGLIFYMKKDTISYSICAYNPVLCDSWIIPTPSDGGTPYSRLAVEFMGDSGTGDYNYKLVYFTPEEDWSNIYRCRVYDSAAQVWTRDEMIHHGCRDFGFHNPVVHRGTVFWASDCSRYIAGDPYVMSYEIATGAMEFLAMPEPDDGAVESDDDIGVAVWEKSWLCLVHYRRRSGTFTVWRWSTTGHSWAKLNEFVYSLEKAESVGRMLVCDGGKEKGMVLVFSVKFEAYVYSFRQRDLKRLTTSTGSYYPTFMAYANTLQPASGRLIN
ncbi:hypothetical protein ZIOFF_034224 [Zingiber officinale]|uniref:F-box domain-containing protein n=1 Tax=Zingiber officinale TaxID=94328 RepID=A0A8J5GKS6_ZINOF|nr:hypothetical protein ZIOFF_034224 [Zingiber officinale]